MTSRVSRWLWPMSTLYLKAALRSRRGRVVCVVRRPAGTVCHPAGVRRADWLLCASCAEDAHMEGVR